MAAHLAGRQGSALLARGVATCSAEPRQNILPDFANAARVIPHQDSPLLHWQSPAVLASAVYSARVHALRGL